MTDEQRIRNLSVPTGKIDVVLDTDAFNEIDDQFAIAYLLSAKEKLNTRALYAAPFHNHRSTGPADGMEKSYSEIQRLLDLMGKRVEAFRGATHYLPDEDTPVDSEAARDLAARVNAYSPEHPLYVVAIGAITNVASAILMNPTAFRENAVVVWLGGHAHHFPTTREFNMYQDVAASRVVMSSGVPFVQLPCMGVVSSFTVSGPELECWLLNKNPLADYLARNTIEGAKTHAKGPIWCRAIWDVTAVAWLLNDDDVFMRSEVVPTRLSSYDHRYEAPIEELPLRYVYHIDRDRLLSDLIGRLVPET